MLKIDAKGVYYKTLNQHIRELIAEGEKEFELINVNGQRYIGDGIKGEDIKIVVNGVPGNDLGAFMDGPTIIVNSNAQDAVGNTMGNGKIIIKGHAGDVIGYGMRGGKIFIKEDVGYRVGIHMKGYLDQNPLLICGGTAGDFFGEYMAGGTLILLGLNNNENKNTKRPIVGSYLATGMHGGVIYIRGEIDEKNIGEEAGIKELDSDDEKVLEGYLKEYCQDLNIDINKVTNKRFIKLLPVSSRPYGNLYDY
ncbi:MAG TPA: hypothetical protein VMW81_02220 [Nitrospinota bacterium]|nr:hypothetical protein [Nitrospinota bacterium]